MSRLPKATELLSPFFIGVAGSGMSALAQFLAMDKATVTGSDRQFSNENTPLIQTQLENIGITCLPQNGSGPSRKNSCGVVSTAIETDNPDLLALQRLGIPVFHRSEVLGTLCLRQKTIAVAGTSGKSTVTAMIFHILQEAGKNPSLLTGAGLTELQKRDLPGNAWKDSGEWLVCEADESDGSLKRYHPEVGLLLNIDRDHKELDELQELFLTFRKNSKTFLANADQTASSALLRNNDFSFGSGTKCDLRGENIQSTLSGISFRIENTEFRLNQPGRYSVENALAATAVCLKTGLNLNECSRALESYRGIHRRWQVMGSHAGRTLVDDFAHNPAKIEAVLRAAQERSKRVLAFFQPHGFGPTRFMRSELAKRLKKTLRPQDEFHFAKIFYVGGTATKDISGADLCADLIACGCRSTYGENRDDLVTRLIANSAEGDLILLLGARDPSLEGFAKRVWKELKAFH